MQRFRCSVEEILERQLFIRSRGFATFSRNEKALAGCKKGFCGRNVVQACLKQKFFDTGNSCSQQTIVSDTS